ncbi:uncharacterized protein A4U43_C07F23870 [Asparagus officinalis]|uniref:Uncharacterized protein n=1 Tax=Asparagus officinalis TaxID=4686 RepID=A0A5P1EEE9_ASPOF|nr:gibberellin-regulated protein 1-like [Asparagus officinalis]ONK64268.1 uncharacterized protein A4U43_C07F23870 [Asparagus officinalis]
MVSSKIFLASLLLFVIAMHVESHRLLESTKMSEQTVEASLVNESAAATGIDCKGLCAVRCSKSSRPNLCHRACGTCCFRCNCVPPGTYGNYDSCPCYATMTTRGGARKCP